MPEKTEEQPFIIRFKSAENTPGTERFKIVFTFNRSGQSFEVPVFVYDEEAVWDEVVRLAKHRLHQDFQQLARQTEDWSLSPDQIAKLA